MLLDPSSGDVAGAPPRAVLGLLVGGEAEREQARADHLVPAAARQTGVGARLDHLDDVRVVLAGTVALHRVAVGQMSLHGVTPWRAASPPCVRNPRRYADEP